MGTVFEPTISMRPPLTLVHAPSMADSLPSINFGFDELRDRMTKFTAKFDSFIEAGRKRVLEERNQFRSNIAELQEDQRMKKKDIEIIHIKTNTHQQTITKEDAETEEMHAAINTLTAQRDAHLATREILQTQIEETQSLIDAKLAQQRAHAMQIGAQNRHDVPELDFWTSHLGLSIEGAGLNDHLKFVFTHLDEKDWTREAWFELDSTRREHAILAHKPRLEPEQLEKVMDNFNGERYLVHLLKGMRELFIESFKN